MPLPQALAAKLSKRGFVTAKPKNEFKSANPSKGFEGCPNKYNIYHECTKFCIIRWKVGVLEPELNYLQKREKMLKKYPIPYNWKEIYDRGCGRFYYWDTEKDLVSWLPPKHPQARLSKSAASLREELMARLSNTKNERKDLLDEKRKHINSEENDLKKERIIRPKNQNIQRRSKDHLDPMDPAAYSDVPRGTWSSGLENRSEAKTGVDTTASGPLYQMRPYPSPGAILAANAKSKHSK